MPGASAVIGRPCCRQGRQTVHMRRSTAARSRSGIGSPVRAVPRGLDDRRGDPMGSQRTPGQRGITGSRTRSTCRRQSTACHRPEPRLTIPRHADYANTVGGYSGRGITGRLSVCPGIWSASWTRALPSAGSGETLTCWPRSAGVCRVSWVRLRRGTRSRSATRRRRSAGHMMRCRPTSRITSQPSADVRTRLATTGHPTDH
jgi:hypothetical protein